MNKVKVSTLWQYSSGRPAISILNSNGYPTSVSGGSLSITIQDEGLTYRSGNRILTWDGDQTFSVSGATLSSGSLSGTNGRAVMSLNDSVSPKNITITLTSTDGALTNLRWLHENDESQYNSEKAAHPNREPFGTKFIDTLRDSKVGVWRTLDFQYSNTTNVVSWDHRMPVDHYSYAVSWFPIGLYAGTLTGSSPTFTGTLSGFSLVDGATVVLDIAGATTASGTPTLNISNTGAKSIKLASGAAWSRSSTATDRRATFTYVEILDAWVWFNDASFDEGIIAGVPPEVCIDLCNAVGCHGHFIPPPMSCDSPSDYMASFSAHAAANLNSGLQLRVEQGPNECWNPIFNGTLLAQTLSTARYGVSSVNDWYGRSGANVGSAVATAFGGDRSRYAILCAFQTVVAPDNVSGSNTSRRIEATRHVAAGGAPASNFITHVCMANYWTTMRCFAGTIGTTAEQYLRMCRFIEKAYSWYNGDAAAKQAAIDWLFDPTAVDAWITDGLVARLDQWSAVAQNYNVNGTSDNLGLTFYEGNYYPGDITGDPTHGIDGVTLGNPTVITINNINSQQAHAFVAGMTCRFRNIVGTTQLNSGTYDILSVTGTTVTIDADSTSFGAFVSGGSGTFSYTTNQGTGIVYDGYGNTGNKIANLFENASKASPLILFATQKTFSKIMEYPNTDYPADYLFAGPANQWAKFDDIYSTPSPQWDFMVDLFNNYRKRKQLTATA